MPLLQANKISYQFDNGERLFDQLSCTLNQRRVGLIGRNGIGKSLLSAILTKTLAPTEGTVELHTSVASYSQLPSELLSSEVTIAQYLKLDSVLEALTRIESGDCNPKWFDIVGEQWQLRQALSNELAALGLPNNPDFPCQQLSGGQLARLQLWQLFKSQAGLLVLDEPSNHLDSQAREWLLQQIRDYPQAILLISHDRQLLRKMEYIWELSSLGLTEYGGNYDFYRRQKDLETDAIERQVVSIQKQQKHLVQQAQLNRERAEQRAAQGNKIRKQGGQPKILLNGMRSRATAAASNRLKNETSRKDLLQAKAQDLQARQERLKPQKMHLNEGNQSGSRLVTMIHAQLPAGRVQPITLQLSAKARLRLSGRNGCGKSTLLHVIAGRQNLVGGEMRVNASVFYLDQHFGLLDESRSMLDNMMLFCAGLQESDARTLLAGIGFRRDRVFRLVEQLSGGEKMKLAMLVVGHQAESPLLLLDEPDNHLDLDSKRLLASTLQAYQGAFVLVSHDDEFVAECGVSEEYQLE